MQKQDTVICRQATPDEHLHVLRLQGFAFLFDAFGKATGEAEIREKIASGELDNGVTYAAIEQSTGRVLAGMDVIPMRMWFDGHKADMAGIGGVATLPEARRQGHVRKLFEKAFADIHEQGAAFSHLFPFSYGYYRKFGYEHCGSAPKYILPIDAARKLGSGGSAHEYAEEGGIRDELAEVYEAYASRHNAMVSRGEKQWKKIFDSSLADNGRLYYWRDDSGAAKAWAKFKRSGDTMEISDIAWADHAGMLGILRFMGLLGVEAKKMSLRPGPELIPELYWENPYDIEIQNQWLGMNRIVNAKRALELMEKPDEGGRFVISVADDFARWNSRTYRVAFGGGACEVSETGETADIEASAAALVQLLFGSYELRQIAKRPDIRVNGDMRALGRIFRRKNVLISDYF
jgi:predicted acetyltransferase